MSFTVVPREIQNNGYAEFWEVDRVHYGLCENDEWSHGALNSSHVSGKPPTYPSPKPTLILSSYLGQNVGLGEG